MGTLREWWNRFDRFAQRFMVKTNPLVGEEAMLAELQRRTEAEGKRG